jgi:hypothetical protein
MLMHQGRRLQDGFFARPLHEIYVQAVKFLVNARRERIERGRIAASPREEKLRRIGDLTVCSHGLRDNVKNIPPALRFSRSFLAWSTGKNIFPTTFKGESLEEKLTLGMAWPVFEWDTTTI